MTNLTPSSLIIKAFKYNQIKSKSIISSHWVFQSLALYLLKVIRKMIYDGVIN